MKIIADTHCHTVASTHAYSTAKEMIDAASVMGLYAIALTDHGRAMPGSPGRWFFKNLVVIPRVVNGVRVLRGAEANVIDYDGTLDMPDVTLQELDWVIASMHREPLSGPRDIDACTNAWLGVCRNPNVNVIGHCGMETFKFDYERVIPEFGRAGKIVEINNNSFLVRPDAIPNCKRIAKLCKKHGVSVVVNSDAHFYTQVGHVEKAVALLSEIDFPEELILNADSKRFEAYLSKNTAAFCE